MDRHFAFLLSPDPLRSTAVPQRRGETAWVSLDWARRRGRQLECLSKCLSGLEAAQLALGHSSAKVTDAVYAERDMDRVIEVMRKIG